MRFTAEGTRSEGSGHGQYPHYQTELTAFLHTTLRQGRKEQRATERTTAQVELKKKLQIPTPEEMNLKKERMFSTNHTNALLYGYMLSAREIRGKELTQLMELETNSIAKAENLSHLIKHLKNPLQDCIIVGLSGNFLFKVPIFIQPLIVLYFFEPQMMKIVLMMEVKRTRKLQ